jgi:YidC/Oxa1 family membrane protein insertase
MKKNDILILMVLLGLLFMWGPLDRHFIKPTFFPDPPVPETVERTAPTEAEPEPATVTQPAPVPASPETATAAEIARPVTTEPVATPPAEDDSLPPERPEETLTIETELMAVTFSSHGGTIREIVFKDYDELNEPDSPPVIMDFGDQPALGIAWGEATRMDHDFDLAPLADGMGGVRFTRALPGGIRMQRDIEIVDEYQFRIRDTFENQSDQPLILSAYTLSTGRMLPVPGVTSTYGMFALGVDTFAAGAGVTRWAKDINGDWTRTMSPDVSRQPLRQAVDWLAVKNKYFVQSLRPHAAETDDAYIYLEAGPERELQAIWGSMQFAPMTISPGRTEARETTFYAGPQQLVRLRELGYHQEQILELGWRPIRFFAGILMVGLSGIYSIFGNYGVAIMLLTVIIRVLFWPLTHKGTESMRRMQEIAPLMKELNTKYKDDAQKRQKAMMELYKEHKVNPMGGCLPMIVQIPVFIGLFYLLRTAIELRYASFLWISDLSEPEGILGDVLPLPLNILPIFMAVTMYFQQKLTPAPGAGDEKQQQMHKMMMRVMPVMMLVLLYNFASGLALYWSTQNVLMIVQQLLYRRRRARQEAAQKA